MNIDVAKYRNKQGSLSGYGHRMIGQAIQRIANERKLAVHEVFASLILAKLSEAPHPERLTPQELIWTACQCGPETSHNYTDAIVLLYRAMNLTPQTAAKQLWQLFKKADVEIESHLNRPSFYDAEFYLGLKRGTLFDPRDWIR